jgi:hypothetical protein
MTMTSQLNRVSITGNGATTHIAVNFPFTAQTDLVVVQTVIATGVQTTLTLTTDYAITGTTNAYGHYPSGGTVIMGTAPASTVTITVYREVPTTQNVHPTENDRLPVVASIENPFDKVTMIAVRLKERIARSLRQPEGDSSDIGILPAKVVRASRYLGFDGDGNPTMMQTPDSETVAIAQLTESLLAALPAAGSAGTLYKVTDDVRGVWMDNGTRWVPLNRHVVNVQELATGGTGTSGDPYTGWRAVLTTIMRSGLTCYFSPHYYSQDALLDCSAYTGVRLTGSGLYSKLIKAFNGDMVSLGLRSEIDHLYMDGNGATYTGRGIIMTTGSGADGRRSIHDCWIFDTASYCIECTAAGTGFQTLIAHNQMDTYNYATYAVKLPTSDSNGPCTLVGNFTNGPGVDIAGAVGANLVGNTLGQGPYSVAGPWTIPSIRMDANCFKVVATGNSFETTLSIALDGDRNTFWGNSFNGGYSITSGATFLTVGGNIGTAALTTYDVDNSGNSLNLVYSSRQDYTPAWTAASVNPAIGNGTRYGQWIRNGQAMTVKLYFLMGGTTTFGTGIYSFSIPPNNPTPQTASAPPSFACGSALMTDTSAGATYLGTVFFNGTNFQVYNNATGTPISPTVPFTWASDDSLSMSLNYSL